MKRDDGLNSVGSSFTRLLNSQHELSQSEKLKMTHRMSDFRIEI